MKASTPVVLPRRGACQRTDARSSSSRFLQRNWFSLSALALMVASDYKLRLRSGLDTLGGGPDVFILLEVACYGLVAACLLVSQKQWPGLRRMPAVLFLGSAYVGLLVVSVSYAPYRALGAVRAMETLVLLGLVWSAYSRATRGDLHRFAHGYLVLVAASVVSGFVYQTPPISPTQIGRFHWLYVHPVTAGVYVGLAAMVAVSYLLFLGEDRPGPVWSVQTYTLLLALPVLGLVLTKTRNAALAALVGLVVLLLLRCRGRHRVAVVLGLLVTVAIVVLTSLSAIVAFFVRGESAEKLASFNSRTTLWSAAIDAMRKEPVFGYGLGASRGIFLEVTGLGGGHNAAINVMVDLGLVGLVLYACLVLSLLRSLVQLPFTGPWGVALDRAMLLAVMAFLTIDGVFFEGVGAVSNVAGDWLFFVIAWAVVLHSERGRLSAVRPGGLASHAESSRTSRSNCAVTAYVGDEAAGQAAVTSLPSGVRLP